MQFENVKIKDSDAELIGRAIQNANDFAEIICRYQLPIRRYVIRLGCRDDSDADDLLQDIFLKVYVNLNDYDPALKFSSWLYRIAHNETISFFRKKNVRHEPMTGAEAIHLIENAIDGVDFIKSLDEKRRVAILHVVLAKLDKQYRDVLVLRFLEEKNYNEISDILKIPLGTVGTLINRGKKRLAYLYNTQTKGIFFQITAKQMTNL